MTRIASVWKRASYRRASWQRITLLTCPFLGRKWDDLLVLCCVVSMSGWSSRGGFYTEERQPCVCSSQHAGASAPAAGNSSLTRIHLQYLVFKHRHGLIALNSWCRRHFPFLFVPGSVIWCSIVMSVNKIFPCCRSTFPIIGCFNSCYKICSHWWNVAAVIWPWMKQLYKISKCFRITFMQHLELTLYNKAKALFVALTCFVGLLS